MLAGTPRIVGPTGGGGGGGTVMSIVGIDSIVLDPNPITDSGTISLINDEADPGATMYYGTDESGTLGWYSLSGVGTEGIDTVLSIGQALTTNRTMDIVANTYEIISSTYPDGLFGVDDGQVFIGDIGNDVNGTYIFIDDSAGTTTIYTNPYSQSNGGGLFYLDNTGNVFLGDYASDVNGTYIELSDTQTAIVLHANTEVLFVANAVIDTFFYLQFNGNSSGVFSISANTGSETFGWVLPSTQGGSTQVLSNDGSGNLYWADNGGGGGTEGIDTVLSIEQDFTIDRDMNIVTFSYTIDSSTYPLGITPGTGGLFYVSDTNGIVEMGDIGGVGNSTTFTLNDFTQTLTGVSGIGTVIQGDDGSSAYLGLQGGGGFRAIPFELRFYEPVTSPVNYVGFSAPAALSSSTIWKLPDGDGTNGQVLTTNGIGSLSWSSSGGIDSVLAIGQLFTADRIMNIVTYDYTVISTNYPDGMFTLNDGGAPGQGYFAIGDYNNPPDGNGNYLVISDGFAIVNMGLGVGSSFFITTPNYPNPSNWLFEVRDGGPGGFGQVYVGDATGAGNGTHITIDDNAQIIIMFATDNIQFNSNIDVTQGLIDSTNSLGTAGQVLSSTGTQVMWVNPSGGSFTAGNAIYPTDLASSIITVALSSIDSFIVNTPSGNDSTSETVGHNIGIGAQALENITSGSYNVAIGDQGMQNILTGSFNMAIGLGSFQSITSGNSNLGMGFASGFNVTTGSYNIILGYGVLAPSPTGNSQLNIGNVLYGINTFSGSTASATPTTNGSISIGLQTPTARLHLASGQAGAGLAPLKISSGTNLTTPEDGAIEYNGVHLYVDVGATRFQLDQQVIAGSFSGSGTATTSFTVTIGVTMANNTYKVNLTPTSLLGTTSYYVSAKTTTTFTVTYVTGLTGTLTFDWTVFP